MDLLTRVDLNDITAKDLRSYLQSTSVQILALWMTHYLISLPPVHWPKLGEQRGEECSLAIRSRYCTQGDK